MFNLVKAVLSEHKIVMLKIEPNLNEYVKDIFNVINEFKKDKIFIVSDFNKLAKKSSCKNCQIFE